MKSENYELRQIVKAWADGEKIQYRSKSLDPSELLDWRDVRSFADGVVVCWTSDNLYRVKAVNPHKQTLYFAGIEDADGHIRFGKSTDDLRLLPKVRQHTLTVQIQGTTSRYIPTFGAQIEETELASPPEFVAITMRDEE